MKLIAAALALLLASAVPLRAQEEKWDARLGAVSGDVTIVAADGSPDASGEAGMPLEEGDRVVVADGASAEVALDGGSLITVRENSDFKIEQAAKGDSTFFLSVGSLLAKIQKLGSQRLRVRTPTAVAAVRGTEFGVEAGDETYVGVFDEGKVEVTGDAGGPPELLIANQETSVKKGAAPVHAIQLQRFAAHRALMRGHGRRLAAIKAKWKALPPEQRREMRKKTMERMRENRRKFIEKRAAMKQKVEDKRRQNVERGRQRRQENLRKMDERRSRVNRPRKDR
ncbi:MAG: FecR domain-containing protein [Elusimicrobia bacterium]|nr:FecR domain-containing protein [Elusimicrobiota bacterium]